MTATAAPTGLFANPYARLMRLHQPVGIWLVFWPCAWALAIASPETPRLDLLLLFFLGAVITRSGGCIVNDMADRDFDKHVERTRFRPLTSGELSLRQGAAALGILVALALGLLLFLPPIAFLLSLPAAGLIVAYPFMKRITWWPQAFLGVTFNWGVLIAWGCATGGISLSAWLLYAACLCWTLGYDTVYGHQDKRDDVKIGLKSTSLRLAGKTRLWLCGFYGMMMVLYAAALAAANTGAAAPWLYAGLALAAAHLAWQIWRVDTDNPASCQRMFKSNIWLGLLMVLPFCAWHLWQFLAI